LLALAVELIAGTLFVRGSDADEVIRVDRSAAGLTVRVNQGTPAEFDLPERVVIEGAGGADTLVLGPGVGGSELPAVLDGGAGNDTLVSLATRGRPTFVGGSGLDAFWSRSTVTMTDAEPVEVRRGVNRLPQVFSAVGVAKPLGSGAVGAVRGVGGVGGIWNDVKDTLTDSLADARKLARKFGSALREPTPTAVASGLARFTGPVFAAVGPTPADVSQGLIANCFILAALASVAAADPSLLRGVVTDLGDGTYAVRIMQGKSARYYRLDADLPVRPGNAVSPAYGQLGADNSLWVALVEKAFALDRGGSYKNLDRGGWMSVAYTALGLTARTLLPGSSPMGMLMLAAGQLAFGQAVTLATKRQVGESPVMPNHAYMLEGVEVDARGMPTVVHLRNPWSYDGPRANGRVSVPAVALYAALSGAVVARLSR
jgi:hypothetical protein